ncbi:MAG: PD-(D/E)XK nuclease family protein [Anaeromyxobacter sp.]
MPALCVVSTPLAAARAARRLCDAQGGVLFGPAVTTLDRLVPGILAAAAERRAVLTPLAERLVAIEAGAAAGPPLSGLAPDDGLAAALASALAELREAEVRPDDARAAALTLTGAAARRLSVLADALDAFESRLHDLTVLDRPGALRAAADAARRGVTSPELDGLDLLVVDGVTTLSPAGWDLFLSLASRAARTRVHLSFFPDRPDLSTPAEPLLRRLEALHELASRRDVQLVLPTLDDDARTPRTAALLSALAGGPGAGAPADAPGEVLALQGAGEAGEADAAAALCARWIEEGLPPDDLLLLSPAPRQAAARLRRAFAARGVPLATGRGPALLDVPVARLVLEAHAAAGALTRTSALRLARSGWLGPDLPGLERLLDRAGALDARGAPTDRLRLRAASLSDAAGRERAALLQAATALDGLSAALAPLARPGAPREHAARLAAFLETTGVRRRAARGPREVAGRDLAALARIEEAAEEVVRALALSGHGATPLPAGRFRALLALVAQGASLPPPPEPVAGAVALLGLDEAPGATARAAVLLGCADGAFPPAPSPEPLLREPERHALDRLLRRQALPTAAARRAEAQHRAFCALAAGRERLALLWPGPGPAGDGGPPAPLLLEALAAAGILPPSGPLPEPALPEARTPRAALRAAARAGASAEAALSATPLAHRARQAREVGAVEAERRTAVLAGQPHPFAGAVGGAGGALLAGRLPAAWTPSQLEAYARCPFRALLRLGARLPDDAAADLDIDVRDEGTLLHAVMERLVRARLDRGAWPLAGSPEDLAEARALAGGILDRFEREGRTGDPAAWAGRRELLLQRLDRIVLGEARDHDGLTPALLEHAFGGPGEAPPVTLAADGEQVQLRGRIDRVDASPERLRVLDYKTGRGGPDLADQLDPEAFGRSSFQVPVYLLAARAALPGRAWLEASYALLRKAERLDPVVFPSEAPALELAAAPGAGAAVEADAEAPGRFASAVVAQVRAMRDGRFPIVSQGCGHCPYGAVCRFEGVAARAAEESA